LTNLKNLDTFDTILKVGTVLNKYRRMQRIYEDIIIREQPCLKNNNLYLFIKQKSFEE